MLSYFNEIYMFIIAFQVFIIFSFCFYFAVSWDDVKGPFCCFEKYEDEIWGRQAKDSFEGSF